MNKKIFIITKCLETGRSLTRFNFNGYYQGHKITSVEAWHRREPFQVNKEYILSLNTVEVNNGVLMGDLVTQKELKV